MLDNGERGKKEGNGGENLITWRDALGKAWALTDE